MGQDKSKEKRLGLRHFFAKKRIELQNKKNIRILDRAYKKRTKHINTVGVFAIGTAVVIALILLANITLNLYIFIKTQRMVETHYVDILAMSSSVEQLYQSNLYSAGLSIIGVAIAVWAGLHILQVIEKGHLKDFEDKYSSFESDRREMYKEQFFSELNRQDRSETQYFYYVFSKAVERRDDIPSNVYYRMARMEIEFQNIYSKRISILRKFEEANLYSLLDNAREIRNSISELNISSTSKKVLKEYLMCREAGCQFNLGYDDSPEYVGTCIKLFSNVTSTYQKLYNAKIVEKTGEFEYGNLKNIRDKYPEKNIGERYTIHVLNTLAESYSKQAAKYLYPLKEEKLEDAKVYLKKAIIIFEEIRKNDSLWKDFYNEFIYRNHGAALERKLKAEAGVDKGYIKIVLLGAEKNKAIDTIAEIKGHYQDSLELALSKYQDRRIVEGVFYAWSALYYKVAEYFCSILDDSEMYKNDFNNEKINFKQWTEEACSFMPIAIHRYPENAKYYKTYSLALLFMADISEEGKDIYLLMAKQANAVVESLPVDKDELYSSLYENAMNHIK